MNYATGYAFNSHDLFENFPIKKLLITRSECVKYFNTTSKRLLAIRVFLYAVKLIILDIINNNVTFRLPTSRESYIHMKRTNGEDFKKARRNGKFLDVDYLESDFSGYELEFVRVVKERRIPKSIHVSKWMKDIITTNTNNGKQYY